MLLEVGRAVSLLLSILSLYAAAMAAFFVPGSRWHERLLLSLFRLMLAALVSCVSGLLFAWPLPQKGSARVLLATLPVRVFLFGLLLITVLFALGWYVTCGSPQGMTALTCG